MAANTSPIFIKNRKVAVVTIVPADTTTLKTLMTAGSEGSRLLAINVVTDDTAANVVGMYVQVAGAGTNYPLGVKSVALRSGDPTNVSALPSVNLLDLAAVAGLDPDGSLGLGAGDVVKVGVQATVTAAKTVTCMAIYGDY
jgi:hypothetical protein